MSEDKLITPIPIDIARKTIKERLPQIKINSIRYLGGGSHSVFSINKEYVFRFPKIIEGVYSIEDATNTFIKEQQLCSILKSKLLPHSTVTQLYCLLRPSKSFNAPIAGYSYIAGTSLGHLPISDDQKIILAPLLGDILGKLHSITRDNLQPLSFTQPRPEEIINKWHQNYKNNQKNTFHLLEKAERDWFNDLYKTFLINSSKHKPNIVLTHGDFDPTNVMASGDDTHLTMIDLDDLSFSDSVGDFCIWLGEYGRDFVQQMLNKYPFEVDGRFFERAMFYYSRIPLLYFSMGKKLNNINFINFGRRLLQKRMANKSLR